MTLDELIRSCPELGEWMADVINDIACLSNSMPNNMQKPHNDNPVKPIINVTYKTTEGKTPAFKVLKEEINILKQKTRKQKHISLYS